jgi:hypothetical protein
MNLILILTDHEEIRKSITANVGFRLEILGARFLPITGEHFGEPLKGSFILIIIHFFMIDFKY